MNKFKGVFKLKGLWNYVTVILKPKIFYSVCILVEIESHDLVDCVSRARKGVWYHV